jgi:hypothetical protein
MRDPNFKNPIYKVLLDESRGGLRALPKSVRFQLLLLPGWALAMGLSVSFRDPWQFLWVLAAMVCLLVLYGMVKLIIPFTETLIRQQDQKASLLSVIGLDGNKC